MNCHQCRMQSCLLRIPVPFDQNADGTCWTMPLLILCNLSCVIFLGGSPDCQSLIAMQVDRLGCCRLTSQLKLPVKLMIRIIPKSGARHSPVSSMQADQSKHRSPPLLPSQISGCNVVRPHSAWSRHCLPDNRQMQMQVVLSCSRPPLSSSRRY